MKKIDNFSRCLSVLKHADFDFATNNEIYRTGVVGQFNLTFELAWKALQAILQLHSRVLHFGKNIERKAAGGR